MEDFEHNVRQRAYLLYLKTGSYDQDYNYYKALNEIRGEMLEKIEYLYKIVNHIEAEPGNFIYLNGVEYSYFPEDFPRQEIQEQINNISTGKLEFRYPCPYYNESRDIRRDKIVGWTLTEEDPIRPDDPDQHSQAKATNDARNQGYDSSEERDLVFRCDIFK